MALHHPDVSPTVLIRLRQFIFLTAAAFCLTPWASPPIALALGAALALMLENPFHRIGHKTAKWLLQASVVLLGFGMNLHLVLTVGASGAAFAAATITITMLLGYLVGKALRLRPKTATLISAGTAICGGSAIAAVGSAIDAEEGDMTVAIGVVFLLNAAALYLFPFVGQALHLTPHQFGIWCGVAIHDVSSVVGAAKSFGLDSLQIATAVKLSRALWIVPLTLAIVFLFSKGASPKTLGNATFGFHPPIPTAPPSPKIQIPWFIALFLLASIARSFIPLVSIAAPSLSRIATTGLTLTLFLIGAGLSRQTIKRVGAKALGLGLILWIVISTGSLVVIMRAM